MCKEVSQDAQRTTQDKRRRAEEVGGVRRDSKREDSTIKRRKVQCAWCCSVALSPWLQGQLASPALEGALNSRETAPACHAHLQSMMIKDMQ